MATLESAWGRTAADHAATGPHRFSNGTTAWMGGLSHRTQGDYACHMPTGWYWEVMQGARRGCYAARSGYAVRSDDAMGAMFAAFQAYIAVDRTEPDPDFRTHGTTREGLPHQQIS